MAGRSERSRDVGRARRLTQAAGLVFYLLAAQALVTSGVGVHVFLADGYASDLMLPALSLVFAASYAVVGYHLRRFRAWARNFAFVFSAVSLFAFPLGTAIGALVTLLIEPAHRARLFVPAWPRRAVPGRPAAVPENMPVLRFDPELVAQLPG
jgi:hypothetical protein